MNLHLNKRTNMMKTALFTLALFAGFNLYADEKLDALEMQSQEFFKAITGLEQDYIKEQMTNIQKKGSAGTPANKPSYVEAPKSSPKETSLSREEHSKNTFNHENEIARIKTDFTRTTKLKDLKIRSM